jgi:hypothetical protein
MAYHIQFQLSNPLPTAHNPNMHVQQRHMRDRRHYLFPNRPPQTDIQIAAPHAPRAAFRSLALYQAVSLSSLTPIATIEPSLFSPEICHVSVNIYLSYTSKQSSSERLDYFQLNSKLTTPGAWKRNSVALSP